MLISLKFHSLGKFLFLRKCLSLSKWLSLCLLQNVSFFSNFYIIENVCLKYMSVLSFFLVLSLRCRLFYFWFLYTPNEAQRAKALSRLGQHGGCISIFAGVMVTICKGSVYLAGNSPWKIRIHCLTCTH